MPTYISVLRGINVSGSNIIKMDELKQLYVSLGFNNVRTYLQSGSVVFSSPLIDTTHIASSITQQIKKQWNFSVPALVIEFTDFQKIVEQNPFLQDADKNPDFLHVTYLFSIPNNQHGERLIASKKQPNEVYIINEGAVYLYCPNGFGRTKLNNTYLEKALQVTATTRNWKTSQAFYNLAAGKTNTIKP